ncbi:MAG TPA: RodZ domain-containing protein [Burkholderiales bacterium]|jgi:cytoskeleton protein RodZ
MTELAMTESIGAGLKAAREARGLSISEVAQQLKFAPRQLEALEQERFDLLPGGTFVRGMVRSYARLLKLEPEPLLEAIAGRFQAPDANNLAARYSQPVPFSDSARRSTFVYLGVSLAVLAMGSVIAYQWYREHNASTQLASKRAAEKRAVAAAKPAAAPTVASAPRAQPKTIEEAPRAEPAAVKVATERPPAMEKAATPSIAKAPAGVHRLVIRCEEEAWIEVKDSNERMLVSSLNPKGAERVVQARGPLTLVIGNAAHVRVTHNDRPVDLAPHTKLAIARFTLP